MRLWLRLSLAIVAVGACLVGLGLVGIGGPGPDLSMDPEPRSHPYLIYPGALLIVLGLASWGLCRTFSRLD